MRRDEKETPFVYGMVNDMLDGWSAREATMSRLEIELAKTLAS